MNNDEKIEHNTEYDHEAFLGVEEAKKFDHLSVEESQKRLGYVKQSATQKFFSFHSISSSALFDRIDSDHNGTITKQELKDWIKSVQTRYITDDAERQWKQINNDSNHHEISWDEYDQVTYHALRKMLTKFDRIITQIFIR